jgi:transposase InsO family protein
MDCRPGQRRGPKVEVSDQELLKVIREILAESGFHGEGYRKVHARLKVLKKHKVGAKRVLRLMRQNGLLAPVRAPRQRGNAAHDGTIITKAPEEMWGTDATRFQTQEEDWCWFFFAIDHCVGDIVGWNASKSGNRFEALVPIQMGIPRCFGRVDANVAGGLKVRLDHGPQSMSHDFVGMTKYLGITLSYSFVREPQCNGIAERFVRTLKEQCLHVQRFKNLLEARQIIGEFIQRFNREWRMERHGYRTLEEVRASFSSQADGA